ncbi:hypothetical protein GCM10027570_00840 [Streptomonospora sediminis]
MNTQIPAGLADGIDPGAITIPQVRIELLEEAAKAIKDDGQDVSDVGNDIKSAWGGLAGVYSAPEDETLFSAIDPVATKGDDVHSAATTVGDALLTFAQDVRPILRRWHSLKDDAEDMQGHIDDNEDWRQDEEKVEEFNQLNNDLLKAQNDFMAAERECANKITALFGGTTFVATEPGGEGSAGKGEQAYGYDEAPQDVATPWAVPQEHDAPWYTDVYAAGVDLTWGSVKDGLGMVGFHDGQGNWTLDRDEVAANTRRYWGDAIAGTAMLAGYSEGEWSWGTAGTAWKEAAHSMVPWREWGDRPGYVITQGVVNIGSIALGAGLAISGYGAPVGGALLAWRGTRVMRALGKVGDLAPDSGAPGGGHGSGHGSDGSGDGNGSGDGLDLGLEPDGSGRRDGPPTTEDIQRELGDWEAIAADIGWEQTLQRAADLSELSEQRQPALVGAPDGDLEINANANGPDNPPTTKPVPPLPDSPSAPERPSAPPIQTPTGDGTGPGSGTPLNGGGGGGDRPQFLGGGRGRGEGEDGPENSGRPDNPPEQPPQERPEPSEPEAPDDKPSDQEGDTPNEPTDDPDPADAGDGSLEDDASRPGNRPEEEPGNQDSGSDSADDDGGTEQNQRGGSSKPDWLVDAEAGNDFNKRREPHYTELGGANEVHVGERTPGNQYRRLDSYIPEQEIVSRKYTQLSEIQESTAFGYLQDLFTNYPPGTVIADTPTNRRDLGDSAIGTRLSGDMILEVPIQKFPVPNRILEKAEDLGIIIRDEAGNVHELPDE